MSVMLRTTNPAAVNEIDPHKDRRVPYLGQIVIFHLRPGEGRAGKLHAPAIVTGIEDDDHIEIMVIFSADDFITRWKIPRHNEQNPVNSWAFNEWDATHYLWSRTEEPKPKPEGHLSWEDVQAMHAEIGHLRNRVAALEAKPKRGRPPKSHEGGEAEGETEGAELASELGYERHGPDCPA